MEPINLGWSDFKAFIQGRGLTPQFLTVNGEYMLLAFDGPMTVSCFIPIVTPTPTGTDQSDFEVNFMPTANAKIQPTNADGIPIHEMSLRRGEPGFSNFTIVSHDLSDRTSWYQNSVQISGETLTSSDGLNFSGSVANWVNINSPKLTYDYNKILERDGTLSGASKRTVKITANGVAVVEGKDFTVNYATGVVTFTGNAPTGPIVANYWHNNVPHASEFLFTPPPGTMYRIEHVEAQFSLNSQFPDPVQLEIWAGSVMRDANKNRTLPYTVNLAGYMGFIGPAYDAGYGQSRSIYRNMNDLINWCNNQYPPIPACGNIQNPTLVMPFLYLVHPEIDSYMGTIVRVLLPNDKPMIAEISTITLYMEKGPSDPQ